MKEVARFVVFLAVLLFLLGLSPAAFSQQTAQIVGTVLDARGNPVEAEVVVQDPKSGSTLARATTNAKGEYEIYGLAPGQYTLRLNPMTPGVEGQTVAATLGAEEGLTVSWLVSTTITAIAAATPEVVVGGPLRLATTGGGSGISQRAAMGLGLGSTPGVSAGAAPLTLVGLVVDEQGNPVAGAEVDVHGSLLKKVTTDSKGQFMLRGLPRNHTYTLTVIPPAGTNLQGGSVTATAGSQGAGVTLRLFGDAPPQANVSDGVAGGPPPPPPATSSA